MENYKDLIVSLIKANRKYPGCEEILDDIVADVYQHAEVVLNTVQNESVITSYLNKIVMTSIITVSRKMGIQSTRSSVAAAIPIVQTPVITTPENNEKEPELEAPELDLAYNAASDDLELLNDDTELEEISEESDFSNEYADNESPDTEEVEENLFEENLELKDELEDELDEPVMDVDKTLVDKMINGITPTEEIIDVDSDVDEEILAELPSDDISPLENNEFEESEVLEPIEDSSILEETTPEISEDEMPEEALPMENPDDETEDLPEITDISEEELPKEEEKEEVLAELSFDNTLDDLSEPFDVDVNEQEDSLVIDDKSEVLPEITESPSEIENKDEAQDVEFKQPSYACFEYNPEQIEIEKDEIIKQIQNIQENYPETDVLEIFKLKYQENLSVDEIAEELNVDDSAILGILNELVYIVKD